MSALSGRSAERWSQASAALTDLWRWQGLLKQVLEQAEKLRSPWRANDLRALLEEESIELTRSEIPLAERDLLGSSERTVRCTPDQLLERMSRAFDEVKTAVARIWRRVGCPHSAPDRRAETPSERRKRSRTDSASATAAIWTRPRAPSTRLAASASGDPLSTRPEDVDRVLAAIGDIRRDLDATGALRRELRRKARRRSRAVRRTGNDGAEGSIRKRGVASEGLGPDGPAPLAPPDDLGAGLDAIAALARSGSWRDARHRLDAWTSRTGGLLDVARQALHANRAPIEARDQFRALLEAYQVKAGRLGVIEDPELEQIFARAHEELYTAPTDLALVSQLVRRYQERLGSARPEQETMR